VAFCVKNNERNGTFYFEFQKGKFSKHWIENNLCLSADIFDELKLYDFFSKILLQFNYYGPNQLTKEQWLKIKSEAEKIGGNIKEVITEIDVWANTVLPNETIISILGI
jgi:hypothetical protein